MPHKRVKNKRGKDIPSVTEILSIIDKPFLRYWYGTLGTQECERIKKDSAQFGTDIHAKVAMLLKGMADGYDHPLLDTFSRYYAKSGCTPVEVEPEEPYVSAKHGYQGTFDWIEKEGEELIVADLKVTSQIHKENELQLAAYANLYNEKHGTNITKGRIYRLDKKTHKLQIKQYDNLPKAFKLFKLLIPLFRWVRGNNE